MGLQDDILAKTAYVPRNAVGRQAMPAMDASKYVAMGQFIVKMVTELDRFMVELMGEPDRVDLFANKEALTSALLDVMRTWNVGTFQDFGHQFPSFFREVFLPEIEKVWDARLSEPKN